jgi:predicted Fe-Mo cluster-binding NifX family protein
MKICIPTQSDDGLAGVVAGHLGRAPFLTLVDTDSGEVAVLANAPHGGGSCAPAEPLAGRGVEAVVCPGAGRGAVAALQAAGIRVLLTTALRVDEALAAVRRGGLRILTADEACGGHHAPGGAEHGRCRSEA